MLIYIGRYTNVSTLTDISYSCHTILYLRTNVMCTALYYLHLRHYQCH